MRLAIACLCLLAGVASPARSTVHSLAMPGDGGDLAASNGTLWAACAMGSGTDSARVAVYAFDLATQPSAFPTALATFAGDDPGLAVLGDGSLLLVLQEAPRTAAARLVARHADASGHGWSDAVAIAPRPDVTKVERGRPCTLADGSALLPLASQTPDGKAEITFLRTRDGKKWETRGRWRAEAAAHDPALARVAPDRLLLVYRSDGALQACGSGDAGRSWKHAEPFETPMRAEVHALAGSPADGGALAWCEAADPRGCTPALQPLRLTASARLGAPLVERFPIVLWPGRAPRAVRLCRVSESRWAALVGEERGAGAPLSWTLSLGTFEPATTGGRYATAPECARRALEILCAQAVQRPARAPQLFVEGYTMRALVAAHELFAAPPSGDDDLDTRAGLASAVDFADSLVARQNACGYWPLGYGEGWTADMAAALGLCMVLEPHVDAARLARYESTVERFMQGLERDGFFLPNGAVSLGWPEGNVCGAGVAAFRSDMGSAHDPYLVSTALAGVVLPAWTYHRNGAEAARRRAMAALEFTLTSLRADGSLPGLARKEGPWMTAAYVEQGWMVADSLLGDAALHARLVTALAKHVDWLVATQHADGSWGDAPSGENTRAPSIVDFLVWYDQRCVRRDDVAAAVRRATDAFADAGTWRRRGLSRAGILGDMSRAFSARALAAVVGARPVL